MRRLFRSINPGFTIGAILFAATLTHTGALLVGMTISDMQHGEEIAHLQYLLQMKRAQARAAQLNDSVVDNEKCGEVWGACLARKRTSKVRKEHL